MKKESFPQNINPGVKRILPYVPGKSEDELKREICLKGESAKLGIIKLASNECPISPLPAILEEVSLTDEWIKRYPDGNCFELKRRLVEHLGVDLAEITPEYLTIGNGSNDVLDLVARISLRAGDEAVFSQHGFAVYGLVTLACNANAVVVPAKSFGHDLNAMLAAVNDNTRIVFIANPNNPTGTWLSGDDIASFLAALPETVIAVIDEAYFEYVDKEDYRSALPLVGRYPNLLVTRSFSKAWGLASLRVGFGVSQPPLADYLNRVRQPFNVNQLAQFAANAVLSKAHHLKTAQQVNQSGMKQLEKGLSHLGLSFIPSAGNFISVAFPDAETIYSRLLESGVIVRPLASYEMADYLRISIGLEEENARLLDVLASLL